MSRIIRSECKTDSQGIINEQNIQEKQTLSDLYKDKDKDQIPNIKGTNFDYNLIKQNEINSKKINFTLNN